MRKRFMGKRLAAALLAAAVAFSSGNFAGGYEYVYAAEASVFYTGTNTVTKDKLDLATEDWDNPPMITYDESIADCVTTKDFTMKADITLDDEAYASLGTGESYLKVQGIVKLGSEWTWTDSQDIPYLQQSSFSEDTHKTTITIKFEDKDADDLKGVYFRLIGQGFSGTCTFSNVTLSGVAEAQPELPAKDPSVIDDFESAETGSSAGWEQEGGWQYDNAVGISVAEFQGSKMLKADLDYTGCEGFTWSEAKIKKSFAEGLDVSAYNVLSYEMIYPEAFDGSFKRICEAYCQELLQIAPKVTQKALEEHLKMQKRQQKRDRERLEEARRPFEELNEQYVGFNETTGGIELMIGGKKQEKAAKVITIPTDRTYQQGFRAEKREEPEADSEYMSRQCKGEGVMPP